MIDYILMRGGQRVMCTDVQVMRGASCWTDHYLVRMKLKLGLAQRKRISTQRLPLAVYTLHNREKRDAYDHKLNDLLNENPHNHDPIAVQNWGTLKQCIVSVTEAVLGRGKKRQPDWFLESEEKLLPLVKAKEVAHSRPLQDDSVTNGRQFRKHQRAVKFAAVEAKEDWIRRMAMKVKQAKKDGRV